MSSSNHPLGLRELCRRGSWKIVRAGGKGWLKETASSRHKKTDAYVNLQTMAVCTETTQIPLGISQQR